LTPRRKRGYAWPAMEISDNEAEIARFWDDKGRERGGTVEYRTLAVLLGEAGGGSREIPGLLYAVDGVLWFEDIPHENWLTKLFPSRTKTEPMALHNAIAETRGARVVSRKDAVRCIDGRAAPADLKPLAGIRKAFGQPAVQWDLADGRTLFFETAKQKELVALLTPDTGGPR
jgi:hypothetical protein